METEITEKWNTKFDNEKDSIPVEPIKSENKNINMKIIYSNLITIVAMIILNLIIINHNDIKVIKQQQTVIHQQDSIQWSEINNRMAKYKI